MPSFPSINTLAQKRILTGDEVIQISATEKTTLREIINQLGFNLDMILTGLNTTLEPGNIVPTEQDTLLSALGKLIARVGNSQFFIMPEPAGNGVINVILVTQNPTGSAVPGYVSRLSFTSTDILLKAVPMSSPMVDKGISELSEYIDNYNQSVASSARIFTWRYNGVRYRQESGSNIIFSPGETIFHTGDTLDWLTIAQYAWAKWVTDPLSQEVFSNPVCRIITSVNVKKDMFRITAPGSLNRIRFLLSPGFDGSPGTEYQCITIRKVRQNDAAMDSIWLMVEKSGYDYYDPD